MFKTSYQFRIAVILTFLCILLFGIHFIIFGQIENTLYYSAMSFCFIPLNTLVVTVVFENVYKQREKRERINKLNMLVGVFFSDLGFELLDVLVGADAKAKGLIKDFNDTKKVENILSKHTYSIDYTLVDWTLVEEVLVNNKVLLMNLMANENLLEREKFTDLLFATVHLRDELLMRRRKKGFSTTDAHICEDTLRVYKTLTLQWWDYVVHLKTVYPFLYESAIARNPFFERKG